MKPAAAGGSGEVQPSARSRPYLILVVEDEEDNLSALRAILRRDGYRVEEARTGPEALIAARRATPDAVLMDLALPGMNGLDVAQLLKAAPLTESVPILALTGSWLAGERAKLSGIGFAGALRKPFTAEALLGELRRLFSRTAEEPKQLL